MPKATGGSTPDSSVRAKKVLEDQMPTHLLGMVGVQRLFEPQIGRRVGEHPRLPTPLADAVGLVCAGVIVWVHRSDVN
ncbi:MAG: hypothetical protein KC519_02030 [Anaerolineae bacterium]|nr:hypothetical protein [Anaerolineae bacterium]